jgi:hypothetical protein
VVITHVKSPLIGGWYRYLDKGQAFQVVAVDRQAGSVDLEYFDGTLEEVRLMEWHGLNIEACEPPQDWTGAFDDIERDDLGLTETDMTPEDWHEPLGERVAPEQESGPASGSEDEAESGEGTDDEPGPPG